MMSMKVRKKQNLSVDYLKYVTRPKKNNDVI